MPYFCTKCNREHFRGKVYDEHKPYAKDVGAVTVEQKDDWDRPFHAYGPSTMDWDDDAVEHKDGSETKTEPFESFADTQPVVQPPDYSANWEMQKNTPLVDRTVESMNEKFPPAPVKNRHKLKEKFESWKENRKMNKQRRKK
jgi:hypothetical protein